MIPGSGAAPQSLSNTSWAFAVLGMRDFPLFAAISAESINRIRDFSPQDLSNSAWSGAKLSVLAGEPLLNAIAAQALRSISLFEP
jgi:hypothetical protein